MLNTNLISPVVAFTSHDKPILPGSTKGNKVQYVSSGAL